MHRSHNLLIIIMKVNNTDAVPHRLVVQIKLSSHHTFLYNIFNLLASLTLNINVLNV